MICALVLLVALIITARSLRVIALHGSGSTGVQWQTRIWPLTELITKVHIFKLVTATRYKLRSVADVGNISFHVVYSSPLGPLFTSLMPPFRRNRADAGGNWNVKSVLTMHRSLWA